MKRGLAVISLALCVAWLTLRALGWRRYVAVLSGTLPEGASSLHDSQSRAALVVIVHLAFVLFAAPLGASALLLHGRDVLSRRRPPAD